jgi:hypothetical protein
MDPRECRDYYFIGEEGYPQCNVPVFTGQNTRAQARMEMGGYGPIYLPHQEIHTTMGFPQSLQPLQNMQGAKVMQSQIQGCGAHTQVLHDVKDNEQRGGFFTAQSSAHLIEPSGRSSTTNHNIATNRRAVNAYYDVTVGRPTPTTAVTSHTGNGSVTSGRSNKSYSLDEHKTHREKLNLGLDMAMAEKEVVAARLRLTSADPQLPPSRGGSRGSSAASSEASSHYSRQDRQRRNKPKHDAHKRSLHAQIDEMLTPVCEDPVTVNYNSALQRELSRGNVSGSNGGSARSGAVEFYSDESEVRRAAIIPHTRFSQDVVDDAGTITLPVRDLQITDNRSTTARASYPATNHSDVQQNTTAPARVVRPYRPDQVAPVDRPMSAPQWDRYYAGLGSETA